MKRILYACLLTPALLFSQSVHLPLGHWAYGFIERMETKGVLAGVRDGSRPYSRMRMAEFVKRVDLAVRENPESLSRVEKQYLERLKGELWDELKNSDVSVRKEEREPHLYSWEGDPGLFRLDALTGGVATFRTSGAEKQDRRVYQPYYGVALRGSLRDAVGFYSDLRIYAEWGSGKYAQNYAPSLGYPQNAEKDSSRATWDASDSYFTFGFKGFQFEFGRDNVHWGPSLISGLMLSGLAPSMDLFKLTFEGGPFLFTWFHGELRSDYPHKWISAHRLEFTPCRGVDLGIHESVIYADRGMETAYLNPVLPILAAQHTLGDRDNVGFGLDADVNRIDGLKLYGEAFIDDFTSPWGILSNYWGNKLAGTVGCLWTDPLRVQAAELRIEYTRIEPFVYTHYKPENIYEQYNVGLGSDLRPNSDRLQSTWDQWLNLSWRVGADFCSMRHGRGDRRTPHRLDDGDEKHFLAGVVETVNRFGLRAEYEPVRDLTLRCQIARVSVRNANQEAGSNRNWNELALAASWNW